MKTKHAFPFKRTAHNSNEKISCDGMTLRQYYAAKAMQAVIAHSPNVFANEVINNTADEIARRAFIIADAMIEAEE